MQNGSQRGTYSITWLVFSLGPSQSTRQLLIGCSYQLLANLPALHFGRVTSRVVQEGWNWQTLSPILLHLSFLSSSGSGPRSISTLFKHCCYLNRCQISNLYQILRRRLQGSYLSIALNLKRTTQLNQSLRVFLNIDRPLGLYTVYGLHHSAKRLQRC